MAHPQKHPHKRKNLAKIYCTRRVITNFVPNFVAMATGVGRGKCDWQHSMAHPQKPPYRRKNRAKISYASRVIANFVSNFVAMATGLNGGQQGINMSALIRPTPKTLFQKLRLYLAHNGSYDSLKNFLNFSHRRHCNFYRIFRINKSKINILFCNIK